MATRDEQLKVVDDFFDGPRELDRLSLMSDDVEWWNGIGKFPGAPGPDRVPGQGRDRRPGARSGPRSPAAQRPAGRPLRPDHAELRRRAHHRRRPYVFRQHTYRATTMRGRPYENVYGFLFRFDDDGLIDRIWEHWGTLAGVRDPVPGPARGHRPRRAADDDAVGAQAPRPRAPGRARGHRGVPRRRRARAQRLEPAALPVPVRRRPGEEAGPRRHLPRRDGRLHEPAPHRRARGQRRPQRRRIEAHRPRA